MKTKKITSVLIALIMTLSLVIIPQTANAVASTKILYEASNISGPKSVNLDEIGFVSGGKYQIETTVVPKATTGWHWAYIDIENTSFTVHDWMLASFINDGYYVNGSWKSSAGSAITSKATTEGIKFNVVWDTEAGTAQITTGNSGYTYGAQTWSSGKLPEGGKFGTFKVASSSSGYTVKSIVIKDIDYKTDAMYENEGISTKATVNLDEIGFVSGRTYKIETTVVPKATTGWHWAYIDIEGSSFAVHEWNLATFIHNGSSNGYYVNGSHKSSVGSNVTTPALTEGITFKIVWDTAEGKAYITTGNSGWTFSTQTWNSGVLPESGTFGNFVVGGSSATVKSIKISECFKITAAAEEGGSVSGGGSFVKGDNVTLTATPDLGYKFAGWYDGETLVSEESVYTFAAESSKTYTAKFEMAVVEYDTTILACTDFQNTEGSEAGALVVESIIDSMEAYGLESADGFFACGDYAQTYGETEANLNVLKEAVIDYVPNEENHVYVQGNHDAAIGTQGLANSGNNDTDEYGVFVINEDDYMWYNSDLARIKVTAKNLADYLNEKLESGYDKPIFVLSHLPLYKSLRTTNDGDAQHANQLFYVLNQAGEQGLNIIFMSGHDHSAGYESYLGGSAVYLVKGDKMNIPQGSKTAFKEETLNFTYMNAGYVGYYAQASGRDSELNMTYFGIKDNTVDVYRFDADGLHNLKSAGVLRTAERESGEYVADTRIYTSPQTITLSEVTYTEEIETLLDVTVNTKGGMGTVAGTGSFARGENVTLTAIPEEGYGFDGWYNGEELLSSDTTYTFTIDENKALTAKFTKTSEAINYEVKDIKGTKLINLDDLGFVSGGKYEIEATVVPKETTGWHWAYIDLENSSFSVHEWNLATFIDGGYYFNGSWKSSVGSNVTTPALTEGITFKMVWDTEAGTATVTSGNSGWTFATQTWNSGTLPEGGSFGNLKVGGIDCTVKSIKIKEHIDRGANYEASNVAAPKSVNLDEIGFVSGGKYSIEATVVPTSTTGWHWAYIDLENTSFSVHEWNLATFIDGGYYFNGSWKSSVGSNVTTPALKEGITFKMVWDTEAGTATVTSGNSGWTFPAQIWNAGVLPEGGKFGSLKIGGNGATIKSISIKEYVDVNVTADKGGSVSGNGTYFMGDNITLTATPEAGYVFAGWYDGEEKVSDDATMIFRAKESKSYTAKFAIPTKYFMLNSFEYENADNVITATLSLDKYDAEALKDSVIVIAQYDNAGRLLDAKISDAGVTANTKTFEADAVSGCEDIQAMFLKNVSGIEPLTGVATAR